MKQTFLDRQLLSRILVILCCHFFCQMWTNGKKLGEKLVKKGMTLKFLLRVECCSNFPRYYTTHSHQHTAPACMCWCMCSRKLMVYMTTHMYVEKGGDKCEGRRDMEGKEQGREWNEWWSKLKIGCKRVWKTTTHRPVSFLLHPISHILSIRLVIWKAENLFNIFVGRTMMMMIIFHKFLLSLLFIPWLLIGGRNDFDCCGFRCCSFFLSFFL